MSEPYLVPGASSFLLPGKPGAPLQGAGVVLAHGFTSNPEEMRPLGDYLSAQGAAVYGVRLAGHGTHPKDLARVRLNDWVAGVEDGIALLGSTARYIFLCGQSLGAMVAFTAAGGVGLDKRQPRIRLAGVIGLSTPSPKFTFMDRLTAHLGHTLNILARKRGARLDDHLGIRREAAYPAYGAYAPRVILEIDRLSHAFYGSLPLVTAPVLLIHPRKDQPFSPGPIESIYRLLGAEKKELVWLEGFEHSLAQDPRRAEVFERVARFVRTWTGYIPPQI